MNNESKLNKVFEEIVTGSRFIQDKLLMTQLDNSITATEEFKWYSKILLAIEAKEPISYDEKIHLLAMHRTFLKLTISHERPNTI